MANLITAILSGTLIALIAQQGECHAHLSLDVPDFLPDLIKVPVDIITSPFRNVLGLNSYPSPPISPLGPIPQPVDDIMVVVEEVPVRYNQPVPGGVMGNTRMSQYFPGMNMASTLGLNPYPSPAIPPMTPLGPPDEFLLIVEEDAPFMPITSYGPPMSSSFMANRPMGNMPVGPNQIMTSGASLKIPPPALGTNQIMAPTAMSAFGTNQIMESAAMPAFGTNQKMAPGSTRVFGTNQAMASAAMPPPALGASQVLPSVAMPSPASNPLMGSGIVPMSSQTYHIGTRPMGFESGILGGCAPIGFNSPPVNSLMSAMAPISSFVTGAIEPIASPLGYQQGILVDAPVMPFRLGEMIPASPIVL